MLITWPSHVDIHAVVFNLPLRGSGSNGGDAQISGVQVLLGPLAVVRLVVGVQHRLLVKLQKKSHAAGVKIKERSKMLKLSYKHMIKFNIVNFILADSTFPGISLGNCSTP